ncbi:translocase [Pseudooceanicola sp. C21-150M6]|uniref:translocase n=1 Tax=Pseudooceanicola sp. C21-150M6 TaxID=3434355 RepID=UPI003D7F2AB5
MVKRSTLAIGGGTLVIAVAIGAFVQTEKPQAPVAVALAEARQSSDMADHTASGERAADPLASDMSVQLDDITLTSAAAGAQDVLPDMDAEVPEIADPAEVAFADDADQPAVVPVLATAEDTLDGDRLDDGPAGQVTAAQDRTAIDQPEATESCLVNLSGEVTAAAMVSLELDAPCQPDARATFSHEGMTFTVMTDAAGHAGVIVPALTESALFVARMQDGNAAAVEVEVNSLAFYDRSVVQWHGKAGMTLHALEFGADYGEEGHVWPGAPRDMSVAATGKGGFVVRLGDEEVDGALMADVYTFPTMTAERGGSVELNLELAVTDLNCGRKVTADILHVADALSLAPSAIEVTMPDCDAVGDFLLLKNIVDDLKIASN